MCRCRLSLSGVRLCMVKNIRQFCQGGVSLASVSWKVCFFEAYGEAFRLSILINEYFGLDAFLLCKMVFM